MIDCSGGQAELWHDPRHVKDTAERIGDFHDVLASRHLGVREKSLTLFTSEHGT